MELQDLHSTILDLNIINAAFAFLAILFTFHYFRFERKDE